MMARLRRAIRVPGQRVAVLPSIEAAVAPPAAACLRRVDRRGHRRFHRIGTVSVYIRACVVVCTVTVDRYSMNDT